MPKRRVTLDESFGKRKSTDVLREDKASKAPKTKSLSEDQKSAVREIFEDVYIINRWHIASTNFLRGIFFGLGTFLGGTIMVALVIWLLTRTVDLFPWAHDFTERLIDSLQKK
jgi:hypothetical protein